MEEQLTTVHQPTNRMYICEITVANDQKNSELFVGHKNKVFHCFKAKSQQCISGRKS